MNTKSNDFKLNIDPIDFGPTMFDLIFLDTNLPW